VCILGLLLGRPLLDHSSFLGRVVHHFHELGVEFKGGLFLDVFLYAQDGDLDELEEGVQLGLAHPLAALHQRGPQPDVFIFVDGSNMPVAVFDDEVFEFSEGRPQGDGEVVVVDQGGAS
jgi:hypothetical protein